MILFSYVGSGGIKIGGCANVNKIVYVYYKFGERSVVFSIPKAKRGILEAIAIKEVRLINNAKTFLQTIPLYIDTFNGFWNESELCTEDDAKAFAIKYLKQRQNAAFEALNNCQAIACDG